MKKYNLYRETAEVKYSDVNTLKEGVAFNQVDTDPELIGSYDTEAEALEALKQYETWITDVYGNRLYDVEEYCVAIEECDDDGEPLEWTDTVAYTPMRISVVDEDDNVLSIHDNYADAKAAYRAYEGDKDIEIRFN